jgi:hypothetical protein
MYKLQARWDLHFGFQAVLVFDSGRVVMYNIHCEGLQWVPEGSVHVSTAPTDY